MSHTLLKEAKFIVEFEWKEHEIRPVPTYEKLCENKVFTINGREYECTIEYKQCIIKDIHEPACGFASKRFVGKAHTLLQGVSYAELLTAGKKIYLPIGHQTVAFTIMRKHYHQPTDTVTITMRQANDCKIEFKTPHYIEQKEVLEKELQAINDELYAEALNKFERIKRNYRQIFEAKKEKMKQ